MMMMRRAFVFPVFAFALLFSFTHPASVGAKPAPALTQYFATLPFSETPFSPLKGIHPISAVEAKTRKHFRFDYDHMHRPVRIAFMQGGDVVDLNDSAHYYFFAPHLEIAYGTNTETRVFFDKHGNRITVSGDVFREVYLYDDRGYRRSLEFYGVDGEPVENSWGVARYEWSLLDDGTVIEKRYGFDGELAELRGGFPFYEVRFHYGPNGWLALMQNFGHEGRLTLNALNAAQDRLEFTANGDLLSWNVLDENGARASGNGPGVARGILERDARGYEIVERYENAKGEPITNAYGFSYTRKVSGPFGNRIEASNYTLDGAELMIREGHGYAGYKAVFDEHGRNRILIEFFDENRNPVAREGRGYVRFRSEFDNDDNETAVNYQDADGNLMNREDLGLARIERDYDNRGRRIEVRFLDKDGKRVNHARAGYATERRTYGEHGAPLIIKRFAADGTEVE